MKTKLFLLTLLTAFALTASAQYKPYYFGFKVAPDISWMRSSVDNYQGDGSKLGFSWGFVSEFNFSENHSMVTGFNVLFNGGKLSFPAKVNSDTGTMSRDYALKFIEVPVMLKMRTNDINGVRFFGEIGLGTAFRIGSKATDTFTHGSTTTTTKKYTFDKIAFVRESLLLGLGAEYELTAGTILGGGLLFNNGFTDILTSKNTINSTIKDKGTPNFLEANVYVLF